MARPVLPTDFKDDVLAESMAGKRRYRIIQNVDGTVSLDDVTDYEQVGSTFGAKQVNDMSSAVNSIEDVKAANNCTTTEPGFVLDARQGKTLMDKSNELSRDLGGFSFHSNENGHYLQKGDEMYLLKNKPLEISSWYYQANGGKTEFILDSSEYKKLSIGQVNGNGGTMFVLGIASSTITLSKEADGYYDVTAYDQIMIRISASSYVQGTVNNIRLW